MLRLSAVMLLALLLLRPAFGEQSNTLMPRNLGGRTMTEFAGNWSSEDRSAGIITRILIDQQFDKALVHGWSRCRPTDCDLGIAWTLSSEAYYGILEVEWHSRPSVIRADLALLRGDRLQVRTKVHFTDGSGRSDYTFVDYLIRAPEEAYRKSDYSPATVLNTAGSLLRSKRAADLSSLSIRLCPLLNGLARFV